MQNMSRPFQFCVEQSHRKLFYVLFANIQTHKTIDRSSPNRKDHGYSGFQVTLNCGSSNCTTHVFVENFRDPCNNAFSITCCSCAVVKFAWFGPEKRYGKAF